MTEHSLAVRAAPEAHALPVQAIAAALLSAAFVALIIAFPLGIVGDYPNHLARNHIEADIASSPALQSYYEIDWRIIPDLAMDIAIPPLSQAIGIYAAGAAMIALAALLGPIAALLLSRRLHGDANVLALFAFAAIFGLNLEFGLINFMIATGLAIAAFALWTAMPPSLRRTLIFAPIGLLLVISHGLGFLLFGYIALLWEIAAFARAERGRAPEFIRKLTIMDGLAMAPGLVYFALALAGSDGALRPVDAPTDFWGSRLVVLLAPFRFFRDSMSVSTATVSALALYGALALGLLRGALKIDPRMAVVCVGLLILMLIIPEHAFGIWGLHFRYGPALIILVAASLRFGPDARRARGIAFGLLAGILAVQGANGVANLRRTDAYLSELRAGLVSLPEGARLLQAYEPGVEQRLANHAGALAVIEANAYVPTLFTNTSPVAVRPEMRDMHLPAGLPLNAEDLRAAAKASLPPATDRHWSTAYYFDWPRRFTHVLYVRRAGAPAPQIENACPVAESPHFVLYRTVGGDGRSCPENRDFQ